MEGKLALDLDSDGLIKNFTVVAMGTSTIGYVEQLILGVQCVGYKYLPVHTLTAEQQNLAKWAQATLDNMEAVGPTTLEFLFEEGIAYVVPSLSLFDIEVVMITPFFALVIVASERIYHIHNHDAFVRHTLLLARYCADVNPSRFSLEHMAILFYQQLGRPDLKFLCMVVTPPENLDIWTLWSRLFDHDNVTLNPDEPDSGGIFPLNYLRGVSASFMFVGKTDEQIQRLRSSKFLLHEHDSPHRVLLLSLGARC